MTRGRRAVWISWVSLLTCRKDDPVAQLDKALGYEPRDWGFNSLRGRHLFSRSSLMFSDMLTQNVSASVVGAATTQDMKKRLPLPDFGMYFHTNDPSPIDFTCRCGPNLHHDLIFLGSYIHDARFKVKEINVRGKRLEILLERDRWERYKSLGKLECIPSLLTVRPVLSMDWESKGKLVRKGSAPQGEEFFVRHVYLSESFWDGAGNSEIVLSDHGKRPSKLRITVRDPFIIRLKDGTRRKTSRR